MQNIGLQSIQDEKTFKNLQYSISHQPNKLKQLLKQINSLISLQKFDQAIKLASQQPLILQFVCDRIQIQKINYICLADLITQQMKVKLKGEFMNSDRLKRLQYLYQLKQNKSVPVFAKTILRYLQNIISDIYQKKTPKGNSVLLDQMYECLNKIQDKIDSYSQKFNFQIDQILKQKLANLQHANKILHTQNDLLKSLNQKNCRQKQMIIQQKWALENHIIAHKKQTTQQVMKIKRAYLDKFNQLRKQFNTILNQIKKANRQLGTIHLDGIYEQIDVSVDDLKNLIVKLSEQNKILKEERQILLLKIQDPQNQHQLNFTQKGTKNFQRSENIQQLKVKLKNYQKQIFEKNQALEAANLQLQILRSLNYQQKNNQNIENNQATHTNLQKTQKETNQINETVDQYYIRQLRRKELQQLRKLDRQAVQNLSKTINQLTDKAIHNDSVIKQTSIQSLQNTIKSLQAKLTVYQTQNRFLKNKLNSNSIYKQRLNSHNNQDIIQQRLQSAINKADIPLND